MHELIVNLHMHTRYSDGYGSHADIAQAALEAGLDVVIVTDHNILVNGFEGYHRKSGRKILMLIGEEVHDQARLPQKSHLLVIGASREMAPFASDPQRLIDRINQSGGLSFIAHPRDPALALFHEDDISWENWEVNGYTGIELWNGLSELKTHIKHWGNAIFYAYFPQYLAHGPLPEVLERWDLLLAAGNRVVAVGGSDAHALDIKVGPLRRTIFPYQFHFRAINTHLLVPNPLSSELSADRQMIYQAFRRGNCFVGYDYPASTRGFRFTAQGNNGMLNMGDEDRINGSVTLQIRLPFKTECQLIKDGRLLKSWTNHEVCAHITKEPGVYRVECYIQYLGKRRGWIFSNPIYLRDANSSLSPNDGPQWSQTTLPVFS
jgi:hypothetical protein